MVRSFGGYFGLQTAPSMWAGAPGIWGIRDISYFTQQAQWPGAGTQFAAVAFTHGPGNIGGSPYLSVYRYLAGTVNNAPSGISTKYPSPSDTVGYRNYGLAFSPDNKAIGAGASEYNYYNFYRWSDSGFGTRYSTPTDTGNLVIMDIHWNSSSNCVALACSTFGTPSSTAANGLSTTVSLYVYKWDPVNGFGTKFANPATVPYVPENDFVPLSTTNRTAYSYPANERIRLRGVGAVCFSSDGLSLIHSNGEHNPPYYVYNFSPTTGFGGNITVPSGLRGAATISSVNYRYTIVNGAQLTSDDKCLVVSFTGTNLSSNTGNIMYEDPSFGWPTLTASITYASGGPKTFGSNYRTAGAPGGIYNSAGGAGNYAITAQARIGSAIVQTSKGTTATTSNTSLLGIHSGEYLVSQTTRSLISTLANTNQYPASTASSIASTIGTTSEVLYGSGIDVTPNGREIVYIDVGGALKNYYAPLSQPLTVVSSSVTSIAPGLPSMAHKVRFNNFTQG